MAKATGPLFSLDARGQLGKAIVYSIWKGINYVRRHVVPENPQTECQLIIRTVITDGSQKWADDTITASDKILWDAAADGKPYSGFNLYMKAYVAANYDIGPPCIVVTPQEVPTPPGS